MQTSEAVRQYRAYQDVRRRIWAAGKRETAINDNVVIEPEREVEICITTPKEPAPRRVIVPLSWQRPLWMTRPLQFNEHVICWMRRKIALELGYSAPKPRSKTMDAITRDVLKSFPQVTLADLRGRSRTRAIVRPRQMAMYHIYRERIDVSLPEIGRFFGGRDHTTVLHAIRKMSEEFGPARAAE